jgi:hypothetical protein
VDGVLARVTDQRRDTLESFALELAAAVENVLQGLQPVRLLAGTP